MIKIHNMDCRTLMETLPNESVDLVVTSPPYDNLRKYDGATWDFETFAHIATELTRVLKPGGVIVWVVGDATYHGSETMTSFRQALFFRECGLRLHDTMIFAKKTMPQSHRRFEQEFEYMFIFSKNAPKTFNPIYIPSKYAGKVKRIVAPSSATSRREPCSKTYKRRSNSIVKPFKLKGNIWWYSVGLNGTTKDRIAFEHPAIFPEQLATDHIYAWSNIGDLVFDPFCGSGTTAKAAALLGRNFIGAEISASYCAIAAARLKPYFETNDLKDLC